MEGVAASEEEMFLWSNSEMTPSDFHDTMDLPAIVLVKDGYLGETPWETLSSGDVIYLESRQKQPRTIAVRESDTSQYYSIPVDYPVPFIVPGCEISEEMPLHALLKTSPLPSRVALSSSGALYYKKAEQAYCSLPMGSLEIKNTYDEKFFRGFTILKGKLYDEPIAVPIHLKVKFANAISLSSKALSILRKNNRQSDFSDILNDYKQASSEIKQATVPTKEITIFEGPPPVDEGIYDRIQPAYITLRKMTGNEHLYDKLKKTSPGENLEGELKCKLSAIARRIRIAKNPPALPTKPLPNISPLEDQLILQKRNLKKMPMPTSPKPDPNSVSELSQPNECDQQDHEDDYLSPINQSNTFENDDITHDEKAGSNSYENQPPAKTDYEMYDPFDDPANSTLDRVREMDDIRGASHNDIIFCLRSLNLNALVPVFKENQIDGELLWELDEEMMKTDLGMNSFQARKLRKFTHEGWRPSS